MAKALLIVKFSFNYDEKLSININNLSYVKYAA